MQRVMKNLVKGIQIDVVSPTPIFSLFLTTSQKKGNIFPVINRLKKQSLNWFNRRISDE